MTNGRWERKGMLAPEHEGPLKEKVKVAQSCPTLWDPMDCSLPGFSVHEILQARILEWITMPFSRGSAQPRDWTQVSCIMGGFFTLWATREGPLGVGKWGAFESSIREVTGSMLSFGKTDFIGVPSCFQLAGGCHHLLTEKPLSQKLPFIPKFSDVPTDGLITDLWLCSSSDLVFWLGFSRIWMLTSFIGSLFSLYSSSSAVNPALGTGHLTRPLLDLRGSLDSSVYR